MALDFGLSKNDRETRWERSATYAADSVFLLTHFAHARGSVLGQGVESRKVFLQSSCRSIDMSSTDERVFRFCYIFSF